MRCIQKRLRRFEEEVGDSVFSISCTSDSRGVQKETLSWEMIAKRCSQKENVQPRGRRSTVSGAGGGPGRTPEEGSDSCVRYGRRWRLRKCPGGGPVATQELSQQFTQRRLVESMMRLRKVASNPSKRREVIVTKMALGNFFNSLSTLYVEEWSPVSSCCVLHVSLGYMVLSLFLGWESQYWKVKPSTPLLAQEVQPRAWARGENCPPSYEVSPHTHTSQLPPTGAPEYRAQPLSFQKGELKAGL